MNMLKRTLAMMLVLCMLFTMAPITAFADDTTDPAGTATPAADDGDLGDNTLNGEVLKKVEPLKSDESEDDETKDDVTKDDITKDDVTKDDVTKDDVTKDDVTKDDVTKDDVTKDDETKDDVTKDDETKDDVTKDDVTKDDETKDDVTKDDVTKDDVTKDDVTKDDETKDDVTKDDEDAEITDPTEDPYGIAPAAEDGIAPTNFEPITIPLSYADTYRILHLDCGRKYFTKDWIIALINEMEAAGFTHLELAFGNDGLRFLLDDMSVGSYSDSAVTSAIQTGNRKYHDFGTNELTQSEMTAIITHANSKGIKIIPLLNNPGHMDAIVSAASSLTGSSAGYHGSSSTVDLENAAAVAFVKGLVEKYVAYFDDMGCNEFNFGADEYANDVYSTGSMGFGALVGDGKYQLFVNYVNEMAHMIKSYGMVPIAFNDGIYFNLDTSYNFDTQIAVAFWTSGWGGYQSASASTMAGLGHKMINVNGDYYYILGKDDKWTPGETTAHDPTLYTEAGSWTNSGFMSSTVSNPMGGMFCIWCDYPGAESETDIAANARMILRAMAAEMQGEDGTKVSDEVIPGGFNTDGTIAEDCNNVTVKDDTSTGDAAKVEVTACGLTSVTVTEAEAPAIADTADVIAWDITPYVDGTKYQGGATVKLPVPADWNTSLVKGFYVEDGQAVVVEDSPCADGFCTFKMPHFSVGGLMLLDASNVDDQLIELNVGESKTVLIAGQSYDWSDVLRQPDDTIATIKNIEAKNASEGTEGDAVSSVTAGKYVIYTYLEAYVTNKADGNYIDLSTTEKTVWNVAVADSTAGTYYITDSEGNYLYVGNATAGVTATQTAVKLVYGTSTDGPGQSGFFIRDADGKYNLNNSGATDNAYGKSNANGSWSRWQLKPYTEATDYSTEVTFYGVSRGETQAVVGTTQYNIEVLDPNDMFTKEENVELLVDEVKTITDSTGNYEASYTGAGLDTSIATVRVKGTTVEGQATITPITSLQVNDTFYIQVSKDTYLTEDLKTTTNFAEAAEWVTAYFDGTYIAIRNANNQFLSTDSNGNVVLSNSWVYPNFQNGLISTFNGIIGTAVTGSVTDPVAATDITITGVSKGETKVIVGETRYNITVIGTTDITIKYQTANGTLIKTETETVADNATTYTVSNFTTEDGKYYVVDNTTLKITPATVTEYTVTVTESEVDLDAVDPLKIEYWITNAKLTDENTKLQYVDIAANTPGIYSNDGVDISSIVMAETTREYRRLEYWQTRILDVTKYNSSTSGTENQTLYVGDDETVNGSAFTHVRYWSDGWQVKTAAGWVNVDRSDVTVNNYSNEDLIGTTTCEKNQLVAYYMEIIDINNANGTTELHVNAADWGYASGQDWGYGTSEDSPCTVSIQLVYQSGSTNPATTETADLLSKTLVYGYWGGGRGLGTMSFDGVGSFEIYQVTAETGDAAYTNNDNGFTINNLTWDGNEEVVWEDENGAASVAIGNPARNPSYVEPYDNLAWNTSAYNQNNAILIRVYVRAVETEEDLKVVYFDEKFGDTLHTYFIKVDNGINFNDHIINANQTIEDPGYLEGSTTRLNVDGFGIMNAYGQPDWFQIDLTQIPEAKGKYNSELYEYTGSEIKDDGKTLYLYYNINTDVLSPNFVADFGLPLSFPLSMVVGEGKTEMVQAVTVKEKTKYGTLSYNSDTEYFTYTPTEVLQNIDVLTISITFDGTNGPETATTNVGVTPATTVYYGEKFIDFDSGWTTEGTPVNVDNQQTAVLGGRANSEDGVTEYIYGYDTAYATSAGASDGTAKKATAIGSSATFTFVGTGIQVFANSASNTGYVSVMVKNKDTGAITKVSMVDTVVNGTANTDTTGGQIGKNLSGLPVVSLVDLTGLLHATYEVTISKVMDTDPVYIDGIRVFGTVDEAKYTTDTNPFTDDEEDAPRFFEARDLVLTAMNITADDSVDYKTLYDQVYASTAGASAIITYANANYGTLDRQDLLDNGPKNELYLFQGDTLTMNVSTDRVIQLGLKAPEGSASFTLNGTEMTLNTTVDMFYKVAEKGGDTDTITVTNTGDKILSVTLLKICDDPNVSFPALTEANIRAILADAGYTEEPEAPAYTMVELKGTDVFIDGTVFDYTGEAIEPAITVNVGGTQLVEGRDYTVTYTNNVQPGTATVTVRGIATASETLGYTGEVSIDYTINAPAEPEVPEETTKPTKPGKPEKPDNGNKPGENRPGNGNNKPGKPSADKNEKQKDAKLKITFVNLRGKKVASATLTKTGTANQNCVFSADEITANAPAHRYAVWFFPVIIPYGSTSSIVVPVF